jgi:hypothetical protein
MHKRGRLCAASTSVAFRPPDQVGANTHVSAAHADVDEVSHTAKSAGIGVAWAVAPDCSPASASSPFRDRVHCCG